LAEAQRQQQQPVTTWRRLPNEEDGTEEEEVSKMVAVTLERLGHAARRGPRKPEAPATPDPIADYRTRELDEASKARALSGVNIFFEPGA